MTEKLILNIIKYAPILITIIFSIISLIYVVHFDIEIRINNIVVISLIIFILILFTISLYISKLIEKIFIKYKVEVLQKEKIKFQLELNRLQDILDELPLMILYKDTDDNIVAVNKNLLKVLGTPVSEILNKNSKEIFPQKYKKYYQDDLDVIHNKKAKISLIEDFETSKGSLIVETSRIPVFDENGEIKNILVLRVDITEKVKLEEEARKKEKLMYQQSKMASMGEMIGNIAHQWRQPLSLISTASTGIKLQKEFGYLKDEELLTSMDAINTSVQYLSQTIDDFRNFFNPKNTQKTTFNILHTFEQTFNLINSQFMSKNIEIIKDISSIKLVSLENELVQVLINILNNARDALVKRDSEERFIFIKCYKHIQNLFIEIKDSGNGIKDEIIDNIFEPYFTTKHQSQGTGIGLYMSLEIVTKLLNGQLKVENEEYLYNNKSYRGAKFTIELRQ